MSDILDRLRLIERPLLDSRNVSPDTIIGGHPSAPLTPRDISDAIVALRDARAEISRLTFVTADSAALRTMAETLQAGTLPSQHAAAALLLTAAETLERLTVERDSLRAALGVFDSVNNAQLGTQAGRDAFAKTLRDAADAIAKPINPGRVGTARRQQ